MARILVVDDALFMRSVIGDALSAAGHDVVGQAGDGVEAIQKFQDLRPELTTLDIAMPNKDGLATLVEILAIDPDARVIMCSSQQQEWRVLASIKLGARDFIVKPVEAARLLDAVDRALR